MVEAVVVVHTVHRALLLLNVDIGGMRAVLLPAPDPDRGATTVGIKTHMLETALRKHHMIRNMLRILLHHHHPSAKASIQTSLHLRRRRYRCHITEREGSTGHGRHHHRLYLRIKMLISTLLALKLVLGRRLRLQTCQFRTNNKAAREAGTVKSRRLRRHHRDHHLAMGEDRHIMDGTTLSTGEVEEEVIDDRGG